MIGRWRPKTITDWVMWAAFVAWTRGSPEPSNQQLLEIVGEKCPSHISPAQIRRAKAHLLDIDRFGTWTKVREYVTRRLKGPVDILLDQLRPRFSSADAKELAQVIDRQVFLGNLVELYYPREFTFGVKDVESVFEPPDFRRATPPFDDLHRDIHRYLEKDLAAEVESFIAQRNEPLGANNLRPYVRDIQSQLEDNYGSTRETGIRPLKLSFGLTNWRCIEGFNNRMIEDSTFGARAIRDGWIRKALPVSNPPKHAVGHVPSYVAAQVIVTGPGYLLVTRRRRDVRYFKGKWSISLEENMQGPRVVTRKGIEDYQQGDDSLHACALRGLEEELGLYPEDVDDLQLLGLFAEAPVAAVSGLFWVRLRIPWELLLIRRNRADREPAIVACEPLDTSNLVRLWFEEQYTPKKDERRDYFVVWGQPETDTFHPSSKARLLAYLLADERNHLSAEVADEFRKRLNHP